MLDISEYVRSLEIAVGQTVRTDCPKCGGGMSFSATRSTSSGFLWHCFRNSCGLRGGASIPVMLDDVRRRAMRIKASLKSSKPFVIPDSFTQVWRNPHAVAYLRNNNCYDAARAERADVRFDVALQRVVFLIYREKQLVGAIGRCINKSLGVPKWYKYQSDITSPFICPARPESDQTTVCIVEDCASACAVSSVCTGLSLNGTFVLPEYIPHIAKFDSILVALDRDATVKGIEIYSYLRFFRKAKLILLDRDLKYESKPEDIRGILGIAAHGR